MKKSIKTQLLMAERINAYQAKRIIQLKNEVEVHRGDRDGYKADKEYVISCNKKLLEQLHNANNELCIKANQLDSLQVKAEDALKRLDKLEQESVKLINQLDAKLADKELEIRVNSETAASVFEAQERLFTILAEAISKK